MNIEQAILNNLRILPPEKQQLLLEFTEFLKQQFITKSQTLTPQEKANNWKQWASSHQLPSPGLSDAAISRETIYE
ncbi:MAG: DUF2281 domain-containing protein [Symploca sp. SIO3E6]|nr:DUF2281 domain-containing protein [Caldora sp. SIO3E6]